MAADELRGRIDHHVGAVLERLLPEWSEEGVVDHHHRPPTGKREAVSQRRHGGDIHQRIGRIGRRLEEDRADCTVADLLTQRGLVCFGRLAGRNADGFDPPGRQHMAEEVVGTAVERSGVEHHIARTHKGEQRSGDRCHATGEDQCALRFIPEAEPILKHFEIRIVEAGIDQPWDFAWPGFAEAISDFEEGFSLLGGLEDEG